MRIPVVDTNHQPLMPTTPARARKWVESGKAVKRWSDCGQFYVQLQVEPSGKEKEEDDYQKYQMGLSDFT